MSPGHREGRGGAKSSRPAGAMAAMIFVVAAAVVAGAAGERVQRMELEGFNRLLSDPGERRMVIAMAAWCAPCRKELPWLNDLYGRYRDRGLVMVGISLDPDGPQAMEPIVRKLEIAFPVYWVGEEATRTHNIYAVPMIYLVRDGAVLERIPGKRSKDFLEKKIRSLLE